MNTTKPRPFRPVHLTIPTHCRPISTQRSAFTRTELLVVIVVVFILVVFGSMILPEARPHQKAQRISCVNNLKQIGTAYRIWANDHGDEFPSQARATNGGWNAFISEGNAGPSCWRNYVTMSNELGLSSRVLNCPSDERTPASDFTQITNNLSLSYSVGVGVNDLNPQGILGGDRNLGPGPNQDPDYGYSPANGQGNDVILRGPVCWSATMHSQGNIAGAGNILLGDGSAQQVTSAGFRSDWLTGAWQAAATNHLPVRLIFP
jgi:competence protein ComGC